MHSEHKPTCVVVGGAFTMHHLDIDRLDEFKVNTNNDSWTIRKEDDFYNLVATYVEQARLSNEIDKL